MNGWYYIYFNLAEEDKVPGGKSGISPMDESVCNTETQPDDKTVPAKNGKTEPAVNEENQGIPTASTSSVSNKPAKRRIIPMAIDWNVTILAFITV